MASHRLGLTLLGESTSISPDGVDSSKNAQLLLSHNFLKSGRYSVIKDSARAPIEEQLNQVVLLMARCAIGTLRYREEQERRNQIREARRMAALAQQAIQDAEKQKLAQLIEDAQRWQQAETIRAFLRAQEAHGQQMGGLSEQQQTFLAWARAKANWRDPLVMQPDAILDQQITIPY